MMHYDQINGLITNEISSPWN